MLIRGSRWQREGEQGQVLAIALVMFAALTMVAIASFRYASVTQTQHHETAITAVDHGGSEGAALYSQIDTSRTDAIPCANGGSGDLVFQPVAGVSTKVSYAISTGQCGTSGAPGEQCTLCVLASQSTDFVINRQIAIDGEIAINGSVDLKNTGELCSEAPGNPRCDGSGKIYIGCTPLATCASGQFSPAPVALTPQITDPLAGLYPKPSVTSVATLTGTIAPGIYDVTTSVDGPLTVQSAFTSSTPTTYTATTVTDAAANWTVNQWAGHFVTQGPVGNANTARILSNTAHVLTLSTQGWSFGTKPIANAVFNIPGLALIYLDGAGVTQDTNKEITVAGPTSGPYKGASIVAAPTDTAQIYFQGQSTLWMLGSLDAPAMTVNSNGGGVSGLGIDMSSGRVVVGSISAQVSNNVTGLVINGGVPPLSQCNVYGNTLSWTLGATVTGVGRDLIQTSCSGGTGIVSFDYNP